MKIGLSSWSYSWSIGVSKELLPEKPMTAESLLDKSVELGAKVLQIADNCPLNKLSSDQLMCLKRKAEANNIQIEVGTRGVNPIGVIPYLEIAEYLQSPLVRTLLHDNDGCPMLAQAMKNVHVLIPELEKRNIKLAIENHDFFKTSDLANFIEEINHPLVGICLDPVNNLAQGESTAEVLKKLGRYTVNFHCKDYKITRKPSMLGFDVEGCAAGDGILDLKRCSEYLAEDISYIIELWTPWQGDLYKTIELEADWAKKSMEYLKQFYRAK